MVSIDKHDFSFSNLISLLVRGLILGGIVFSAITYFPAKTPSFRNRVFISIFVVVLYALIDYINRFLGFLRNQSCSLLCGCDPSTKVDISKLANPEFDIEKITKSVEEAL